MVNKRDVLNLPERELKTRVSDEGQSRGGRTDVRDLLIRKESDARFSSSSSSSFSSLHIFRNTFFIYPISHATGEIY